MYRKLRINDWCERRHLSWFFNDFLLILFSFFIFFFVHFRNARQTHIIITITIILYYFFFWRSFFRHFVSSRFVQNKRVSRLSYTIFFFSLFEVKTVNIEQMRAREHFFHDLIINVLLIFLSQDEWIEIERSWEKEGDSEW